MRAAALEYATLHSATTAAPSALAGGVPAAAPTTEHTIDVAPTFSPPSAPAIPPRRGLTVCRNEPAIPPQKVALVKGTGSDRHTSLSQPIRSTIGGSEDPLRSCLRSAREESEVGDEVIDVGDVAVTRRPRSSSGVVVDVAALGLPQQTPEAIRRSVSCPWIRISYIYRLHLLIHTAFCKTGKRWYDLQRLSRYRAAARHPAATSTRRQQQ